MIKEYFFKTYYYLIYQIKIYKTFIILQIKTPTYVPKIYYKYLFYDKYGLKLYSIKSKNYNINYKILILKFII